MGCPGLLRLGKCLPACVMLITYLLDQLTQTESTTELNQRLSWDSDWTRDDVCMATMHKHNYMSSVGQVELHSLSVCTNFVCNMSFICGAQPMIQIDTTGSFFLGRIDLFFVSMSQTQQELLSRSSELTSSLAAQGILIRITFISGSSGTLLLCSWSTSATIIPAPVWTLYVQLHLHKRLTRRLALLSA